MNNYIDTTLFQSIKQLIEETRKRVVRNINAEMVLTNFEIGRRIVDEDQKGKSKADYAGQVLQQLSERLTKEFGKGYSIDNLENFRRFYMTYADRISETLSRKLETTSPLLPQGCCVLILFTFGIEKH